MRSRYVFGFIGIPLFFVVMFADRLCKFIGAPRLTLLKALDGEGFSGLAAAIGLAYYCGIATTIIAFIGVGIGLLN